MLKPLLAESSRDWSPYDGMDVRGRMSHVFLRGFHVVVEGELNDKPRGKYLYRKSPIKDNPV